MNHETERAGGKSILVAFTSTCKVDAHGDNQLMNIIEPV